MSKDKNQQASSPQPGNPESAAADQLRSKVVELRSRLEEAAKPVGPLTALLGIHTSST
jgi:hypothetical protein